MRSKPCRRASDAAPTRRTTYALNPFRSIAIGTVVYIRMCVSGARGSPDSSGHLRSRELMAGGQLPAAIQRQCGVGSRCTTASAACGRHRRCAQRCGDITAGAPSAKDLYGVEAILRHRSHRGTVHRVPGQVTRILYRRRYLGPGSAGCGHQSNHPLLRCTGDGSGSRACHALSDFSSSPRVFGGGHVREPCFPTTSGGHEMPATGHSSMLYLSPSLLSHGFPHWGF